MAATPKRKSSSQRQGKRRSQIKLKLPKTVICPQCKKLKLSHHQCQHCS